MAKIVNMNNNYCVRLYANNPRTDVRIFIKFDIQELNLSTNLNPVLRRGRKKYQKVFMWMYTRFCEHIMRDAPNIDHSAECIEWGLRSIKEIVIIIVFFVKV